MRFFSRKQGERQDEAGIETRDNAGMKPVGDIEKDEEETNYQPINWKKIFLTPKYIPWHILIIAITVATVLLTVYHDQVVEHLRPFSEKVRDLPAGWLIPVLIMIILSFPPLFGQEIVALLCGVVYGLWIGFAIVAAGTFVGEIGTWFLFSSLLRPRATRLERTNLTYASLARITRHGGFPIVLIIRLSAIPSHFSTAVFSTCDVKFWYFFVATFLSLPKQIVLVWLGVLLVEEREGEGGAVQTGMFVGLGVATVVLAGWIGWRMRGVRGALLEEQEGRRKGRQAEREGREKEKEKDREEVVDTEEDLTRLSPVALD